MQFGPSNHQSIILKLATNGKVIPNTRQFSKVANKF